MKRLRVLFALASGLACSGTTSPNQEVRITIADTSIAATINHAGSVDWLQFTLRVTVDNRSSETVAFNRCLSSIERNDGMAWSRVWGPACFVTTSGDPEVSAGQQREFDLDVVAAVAGPGGPTWDSPTVDGTYRFQSGVYAPDGAAVTATPSNAFVVRTAE